MVPYWFNRYVTCVLLCLCLFYRPILPSLSLRQGVLGPARGRVEPRRPPLRLPVRLLPFCCEDVPGPVQEDRAGAGYLPRAHGEGPAFTSAPLLLRYIVSMARHLISLVFLCYICAQSTNAKDLLRKMFHPDATQRITLAAVRYASLVFLHHSIRWSPCLCVCVLSAQQAPVLRGQRPSALPCGGIRDARQGAADIRRPSG